MASIYEMARQRIAKSTINAPEKKVTLSECGHLVKERKTKKPRQKKDPTPEEINAKKEKQKKYMHDWYVRHKEELTVRSREWCANNREKARKFSRNYYWAHREERNAASKKWREEHKEEYNARMRAYRKKQKEKREKENAERTRN